VKGGKIQIVKFKDARACELEPGWYRVSLAERDSGSVEYFENPPGHSIPMHEHKNKQIMVVVKGKMKVYAQDEEAVLGEMDSVFFDENEPHKIENALEEKV
jgi:quercetin dioxygenase-like cupin family protein